MIHELLEGVTITPKADIVLDIDTSVDAYYMYVTQEVGYTSTRFVTIEDLKQFSHNLQKCIEKLESEKEGVSS